MVGKEAGTAPSSISQVPLLGAHFGSRGLLPAATAPALFSSNKDPADRTVVAREPKMVAPSNSDTEKNMPAPKTRTRIPKAMRWSRLSMPLFKCHQPDGLHAELWLPLLTAERAFATGFEPHVRDVSVLAILLL